MIGTVQAGDLPQEFDTAAPLREYYAPGKPASRQPAGAASDSGYIDWQAGTYVARVSAPLPETYRGRQVNAAMARELALRVSAALADSLFLQMVADTRVDASQRLSQLIKDDAAIRLSGNIRGKRLVQDRLSGGDARPAIEATYQVSMRGVDGVIAQLYERVIDSRPATRQYSIPANARQAIVIDARGTALQPALFPSILDSRHETVMDPAAGDKTSIVEHGAVEYVVITDQPLQQSLADLVESDCDDDGSLLAMLVIRALQWLPAAAAEQPAERKRRKRGAMKATDAAGLLRANIIVGDKDAETLRQLQSQGDPTNLPRVIVVTDGTIGGTEGSVQPLQRLWARHCN
jgi:hypothetical protein